MCAERCAAAAAAAACAAARMRVTAQRPRDSQHQRRSASLRSVKYIRRSVSLRRGRLAPRGARGPVLPAWLHPRRARPPTALCAPSRSWPGRHRTLSCRGEERGRQGRPHPELGRGQSACIVPTWGGPGLHKPSPLHPSLTPPVKTPHISHRSAKAAGSCSGSCGRSWGLGRPREAGGRGIDCTPSAVEERGLERAKQVSLYKKLIGHFSQNLKHYVRHYVCSVAKSVILICLGTLNVFYIPTDFFFVYLNNISPLLFCFLFPSLIEINVPVHLL